MRLDARVIAVLLALAPSPAAAELRVTVRDGRVDLVATAVPLSEILEQLARRADFKLVQDGAVPPVMLSVRLENRTPVEAVLDVLDGLGVGYVLAMDATSTRLATLILFSAAAAPRTAPPLDLEAPLPAAVPEYPVVPEPIPEPVPASVSAPVDASMFEPAAAVPSAGSEPPPLVQVHSRSIHPSTFTPAAQLAESLRGINLTAPPSPAAPPSGPVVTPRQSPN